MSRHFTSTRVAFAAVTLFALTAILPIEWTHTNATALSGFSRGVAGSGVIINEVDTDQPGTDTAEFVELYDGGVGNVPLDGYVVVFFNGGAANDASYAAFDLDGFSTNPQGYFTLGNSSVPGVDLVFPNGSLQNGPDAISIFAANSSDFPNATPITTVNIVDALVYNNAATIDAGLLVLLNAGQLQVNENGLGTGTTSSMQRIPNGTGGERNTTSYQVRTPTPDGPNLGPSSTLVSLSGRVTNPAGNGIRGARMILEGGGMAEPRFARTASFGYYSFDGIATGVYMVTISSKGHTFAMPTRVVTLNDNVTDFDFVTEP